jgi:acyl-coenzyme A thioesterase PaaI-like protein
MGFRYVRMTRDEVVVEYDVADIHKQPYGIVHGGVHCGVVEAVCSTGAALDAMPRGPERRRAREPHLVRAGGARRHQSR